MSERFPKHYASASWGLLKYFEQNNKEDAVNCTCGHEEELHSDGGCRVKDCPCIEFNEAKEPVPDWLQLRLKATPFAKLSEHPELQVVNREGEVIGKVSGVTEVRNIVKAGSVATMEVVVFAEMIQAEGRRSYAE
jgi:hypothetical protein